MLKLFNPFNWLKTGIKVGVIITLIAVGCLVFSCLGPIVLNHTVNPKYGEPQSYSLPQRYGQPQSFDQCWSRADAIGAPWWSSICDTPTADTPAKRVQSGDFVGFGTFTVDGETRVWILENWYVPSSANYSYDYSLNPQAVLNAPFVVGSETNPVDGGPFRICFHTDGPCKLPVAITFRR